MSQNSIGIFRRQFILVIFCIVFLLSITNCSSTDNESSSLGELTSEERVFVINRIDSMLIENYVFPVVGQQSGAFIKSQLSKSAYDEITNYSEFAIRLTSDLQSINSDKHMRVRVRNQQQAEVEREDPTIARLKMNRRQKSSNYGYNKVEILENNIGYLDLRYFASIDISREKATSAMRFLQDADAIIFDLRKNGGGSPTSIQYICSYLFDESTHLNSLYWRRGDRTEEFWTLDNIDGRKRPDVPVFVLTSKYTFSGAEEFTYNLKTRNRATIIGETTGGGANPGGMMPINEHFNIFIPTGKAINPVTKTNWEGTGVEPDIEVNAEEALDIALEKASEAAQDYSKKQEEKQIALVHEMQLNLEEAEKLFAEKKTSQAEQLINSTLKSAVKNEISDEGSINMLGYDHLGKGSIEFAIAVFKLNVEMYPKSSNVYDSLGEAYMKNGDNKLAIFNYKKSLDLDPNNTNAVKMLEKMGVKI